MDWFKQNPFLGALALATSVAVLGALYFLQTQHSAFIEQTDIYASNTATLAQLQQAKPFPDGDNLKAAEDEANLAEKLLTDLSASVARQAAPIDAELTPRAFQDKLSAAVAAIDEQAAAAKVKLPEGFYLGFEQYRVQPPAEEAAPALGQQLEAISNVAKLLVKSGVREISGISRTPLPSESGKSEEETGRDGGKLADLIMAPFDVAFVVADEANFRQALNAIVAAQPFVAVRLVSVANSRPVPPEKGKIEAETTQAPAETTAEATTDNGGIPVVFGQETLTVKLRLASVSVVGTAKKK